MLVSFALGDTNFSRHPTQNPNASQWNIGCVGFQRQNVCVGHVHFVFFVLISFAFVGQRKASFQWNMGLRRDRILLRILCDASKDTKNLEKVDHDIHSRNKVKLKNTYSGMPKLHQSLY